jgi:hypothetical protein
MWAGRHLRDFEAVKEKGFAMMGRTIRILAVAWLALAGLTAMPRGARAALTPLDTPPQSNSIEARQYNLRDLHVAGNESLRQNITAFRVTNGSWNGESLGGLSLVLVETSVDNGEYNATTNCYVSHLATVAQRDALVSAFLAAKGLTPDDVTSWRFEPSMITIDVNGQTLTIHLGLIS